MPELNKDIIHRGHGLIRYKGRNVGTINEVVLTFQDVGFEEEQEVKEKETSVYGTLNGEIHRKDLIPDFNSPHPTPVTIELTLKEKQGEIPLRVENVEFIDDIPKSGIMEDIEFHGVVAK